VIHRLFERINALGDLPQLDLEITDAIEKRDVNFLGMPFELAEQLRLDDERLIELLFPLEVSGLFLQFCYVGHRPWRASSGTMADQSAGEAAGRLT
jgi:hypothetical protein